MIRARSTYMSSLALSSGMSVQLADYRNPSDGVDLTGAWARARAQGQRNIEVKPGNWTIESVELPDLTPGESWTETEAFSVRGVGPQRTIITLTDPNGTGPMLGMASVGGTTNRGQASYYRFEDMTLIGAGDITRDRPLIALSNVAKPVLRRLELQGNPAGPGILLYSYQKGGSWGALVEMCNTQRVRWETLGGDVFYSLSRVRERLRYFIHLKGPRNSTGKCNDVTLLKNEVNDCLIGGVSTEGFGTVTSGFPGGGGADNLLGIHNFYASQGTRKMEQGNLTSAAAGDDVIARLDYYITEPDDAWVDCVFSIQSSTDGRWHAAYIDGYTASSRRFVLDRALPIVSGNEPYRISYGDAAARAGFAPNTLQHGYYWEPNAYAGRSIGDRFEEIRTCTAYYNADSTLAANSKFSLVDPYRVVDSVDPSIRADGSEYIHGVVAGAVTPAGGGVNGGMSATFIGVSLALLEGENLTSGEFAITGRKTNDTGHDLANGDVVQEPSAAPSRVQEAVNYTNGTSGFYTSYIVWGARQVLSKNGEGVSIARRVGEVKVKVCNPGVSDLVITKNDFAVPMAPDGVLSTTGYATALASGSATVRQAASALGVFRSSYTVAPGEVVYLFVTLR